MKVGIQLPLREDIYERVAWAAGLGFHSGQLCAWNIDLYTEAIAEQLKKACRDFDFTITAIWCGWTGPKTFQHPYRYATIGLAPASMRDRRTRELLDGAAFARSIGVKDVITHMGFISDNPFAEDHIGVAMAVREICQKIAPYGQRFLFETGEIIPSTILSLIQIAEVENVGVNFDPANFLINGRANPSDAMDRLAFMTYGFHAKDGVYATGFEPKGKEVQIGQGQVNFAYLLQKMKDAGFDGDITIEREIKEGPERDRQILEEKVYLEELIKNLK